MPPALWSCGSNGSSLLSLGHAGDVHTLSACIFHPSVAELVENDCQVVDLVSASTHSLLLLRYPAVGARLVNGISRHVDDASQPVNGVSSHVTGASPPASSPTQSHTSQPPSHTSQPPSHTSQPGVALLPNSTTNLPGKGEPTNPGYASSFPSAAAVPPAAPSLPAVPFLPTPPSPLNTILLGAGTNTLGQLGPRCALWDEITRQNTFKPVDLLTSLGHGASDEWEPCAVAATWTTSFVVFRRKGRCGSSSSAAQLQSGLGSGSGFGVGSGSPRDNGIGSGTDTTSAGRLAEEQMVVACGSNDFGELSISPNQADVGRVSVTKPSDKPTVVDLGLRPGERVDKIRGGQKHVLALVDGPYGQRLVGWGSSRRGEMDPTSIATATTTASSTKGKGKATPFPTTSPPTLIPLGVPQGQRIVDIALGASHSVALLSDGQVVAWGSDAKGQISGLNRVTGVKAIAATWGGTYLLTETGELWSQGSNSHSQLLHPRHSSDRGDGDQASRARVALPFEPGMQVDKLVAGSEHVLVLGRQGELWAGGWNEHGNLGMGDCADRDKLVRVDLPASGGMQSKVTRVWGGCAATWMCCEPS